MLSLLNTAFPPNESSSSEDDDGETAMPRQCISYGGMTKLHEMRVNNQLCDCTIRTDDESTFCIHRAILCACSSYFSALFISPFHPNENTFFIPGISSRAMEWIITFAYLRDVSLLNDDNVFEVYAVADYFGMSSLMKPCVEHMVRMLSPENCIGLWMLAKFRTIGRLVERSWNFISGNFSRIATLSAEILQLDVDDLFSIISDELLNVKDESVVWEALLRWIDFKPASRVDHLPKLMRAVRLGLLSSDYFMEKVKKHPYVENNEEVRPLVIETMRFLCDLETPSKEILTPSLALPRLPHEVLFAIGGWSEGSSQNCIEIYDTRADRWVTAAFNMEDPSGPRSYHGTAVIGTKLYIIGGFDGRHYFNSCCRFDAVKKRWKEIAPMHQRRCYVSVTVLNGIIYALGGFDGNTRQNTAERYCPRTNQWSMIAPMASKRSDADACSFNGKVYITGGFNGQECLNTAECYDPDSDSWTTLPQMISRRSGVSCAAHGTFIFVIGGFNGLSRMNTGERYDPARNTWTLIREMHSPRSNFGLAVIDDIIMAVGGFNGNVTIKNCECYLPESDEWVHAADMSMIKSALTANVIYGLPNVRDYVHQNRHKLIEEKRMRILGRDSSIMSFDFSNENSESVVSIQVAHQQLEDESESENESNEEDDDDDAFEV